MSNSARAEERGEGVDLGLCGGPTRGETRDAAPIGELLPGFVEHETVEEPAVARGENGELLIGGRVDKERYSGPLENGFEPHRHRYGVAAEALVEPVGEERGELQAEQPALWHTLDGRRLSTAPALPGIYLYQGKKIVVK